MRRMFTNLVPLGIDESWMAEDKSILTAAGKNNSLAVAREQGAWVVYQTSGEFLMTSTGEYQSSRLMLGMQD